MASGEQIPVLKLSGTPAPMSATQSPRVLERLLPSMERRMSEPLHAGPLGHCLAFFTMVPTAEITVVLEPLALVVTVTTAGRVAVVVRMVGWAIVVTGMAESHLLFLFWASGVRQGGVRTQTNGKAILPFLAGQGSEFRGPSHRNARGSQ